MTPNELRERTTTFSVGVVRLCRQLRARPEARNIADQLSAAATAIAANYRSAARARSKREFVSKLAVAVEEADETVGWLEIVTRSEIARGAEVEDLLREARELVAILAASRKTAQASR